MGTAPKHPATPPTCKGLVSLLPTPGNLPASRLPSCHQRPPLRSAAAALCSLQHDHLPFDSSTAGGQLKTLSSSI